MRIAVGCLGSALLLAACASSAPPALAGRDVACLNHQVYDLNAAFDRGVALCGDSRPDLTGSAGLQQLALVAKIPFTIRPIADARIKQADRRPLVGSLIPTDRSAAAFSPEPEGGPADFTGGGTR